MRPTLDLNAFFRLKAILVSGRSLSFAERSLYRRLGRAWCRRYRELGDRRGVAAIERDLGLLRRKRRDAEVESGDLMT